MTQLHQCELYIPSFSLADCEKQTVQYTPIKTTKEHNMAYYDTKNMNIKSEDVDQSRVYALNVLENVKSHHRIALSEKFFIIRPHPKTWEEAKKWYDEDYFILSLDLSPHFKKFYYGGFFDYIHWGDKQPDEKGFEAADKLLDAAYTVAKDIISVKSDENERLKALQDFRNYTIH